ncbi:MAG: hypothetical protein IPK16_12450 [Anaerolineales bacterium]|nr:hypothetical protein [Anaerolineales bacterium]
MLAPLMVGTKELHDALLADEVAKAVADRWQRLDIAVVGIGALPAVPGQIVYLGEANVGIYLTYGAVGDMVARHYGMDGAPICTDLDDRILGPTLDQLSRVKTVVAVAGGMDKTKAIIGALHTKLITDLFMDQDLAQSVLDELG